MPIPFMALAGLGSSLVGGISGKKAQKKQQELARQQMQFQQNLAQQQMAQQQQLIGQASPFMTGASQAMQDVQGWWTPLLKGNTSAINQFLSPERSAINQGYQSAVGNVARFGPRGGGQVSSLAAGDLARQQQLSNLVFGARQQAAGALGQLGQAQGALGQGILGMGGQFGQMASGMSNRGFEAMMDSMRNPAGAQNILTAGQQIGTILGGFSGKKKNTASGSGSGGSWWS